MSEGSDPTDGSYQLIVELVEEVTGADIADHLVGRVAPHVARQLEPRGIDDPEAYLAALRRGVAGRDRLGAELLDDLLAALLVHETFFYRFATQLGTDDWTLQSPRKRSG